MDAYPVDRPDLFGQFPADQQISSVAAEGDQGLRKCHNAIAGRGANAIMPPL